MKDSKFVFESVDLLYYSLHKMILKRGKSYIKSPKLLRNKGATVNPENKDNECYKYSITAALNHQNIENHPERISNLKPFIDQYNWNGIRFPSHLKDWKKFEQNNKTIALNVLFIQYNTKKIGVGYKSKYNHKRDNQVNLLMITDDGENWHYVPVKSISAFFRGITSNNNGDYYCLNCFHSYLTNNKLKRHETLCDNYDYCHVKMPKEDNEILKYNRGEKSLKAPFIIIADLECILPKISSCQNNPEKSYTERKAKHEPSGYSWITCSSFDESKNKRSYYRGKDCMEMFSKDLRNQVMKIINYKKKEIIPLTDDKNKSCEK